MALLFIWAENNFDPVTYSNGPHFTRTLLIEENIFFMLDEIIL